MWMCVGMSGCVCEYMWMYVCTVCGHVCAYELVCLGVWQDRCRVPAVPTLDSGQSHLALPRVPTDCFYTPAPLCPHEITQTPSLEGPLPLTGLLNFPQKKSAVLHPLYQVLSHADVVKRVPDQRHLCFSESREPCGLRIETRRQHLEIWVKHCAKLISL